MELFNVYPLVNITPVKALGAKLWDDKGQEYLDFYGGHAVISIGHSHPHYVQRLTEQLQNIGFYSNSVQIPIQQELAHKLGQVSGYKDYSLFLCNSGAEANEGAFKFARRWARTKGDAKHEIVALRGAFHGRLFGTLAATDRYRLAVRELERCVKALGLPGVQIGSHVNDWNLSDPALFEVFAAAAELGAIANPAVRVVQALERLERCATVAGAADRRAPCRFNAPRASWLPQERVPLSDFLTIRPEPGIKGTGFFALFRSFLHLAWRLQ